MEWAQRCAVAALLVAAIGVVILGQPTQLAFEVASVKRIQPKFGPPPLNRPRTGVFFRAGETVSSMMQFAYGVTPGQVLGGPNWVREVRFEVNARVPPNSTDAQIRRMVQALLEERFRLVVRKEQREMPHSALVIARDDGRLGPKLERCEDPEKPRLREPLVIGPGGVPFVGTCTPTLSLANAAARVLQSPVVDKTGLDGLWTYSMVYAQSQPLPPGPERDLADQAPLPSFAIAMQEELGLKLERIHGAMNVVVIESIDELIEN